MPTTDIKTAYLARLTRLVQMHEENRRERFMPFLILLRGDKNNPRFSEAMAIGRYFLDNALPAAPEDKDFYNVVADAMAGESPPDYFEYAGKTPYFLADYLKVIYDLRSVWPCGTSGKMDIPIKQTVISQVQVLMGQQRLTKTDLARKMRTSRASLDRLLDPERSVSLQTLQKAARALGQDISLRFVPSSTLNEEHTRNNPDRYS
ncbi:MAG: helix-turn-helix transcriptional regulator [Thermodesulfobacteriota bacterium]|nr:helix-turn-helix transcriptional regulator [Thermodesulfobacteriota bacterium]